MNLSCYDGQTLIFTVHDYDEAYKFSHWETYYRGPITSAENYTWSDNYCFSKPNDIHSAYSRTDRSIQVNNETIAIGTYYIVADPYDTSDHYQDGYYVIPAEKFYYMWNCVFPGDELAQSFIIAQPAK